MSELVDIEQGCNVIASGGVIAYPTEAVYGLGCNPNNLEAVQAVLNLKHRAQDKGLILVASNWVQLEPFIAPLSQQQRQAAQATWPGPVTWVMPASSNCPALLTGGRDTIAVRMSAHPTVTALCDRCAHALVSTSANTSGEPAITDPSQLLQVFGDKLQALVVGELGGQKKPSKIFDVQTGKQLR